jgi:hypothetical protein
VLAKTMWAPTGASIRRGETGADDMGTMAAQPFKVCRRSAGKAGRFFFI